MKSIFKLISYVKHYRFYGFLNLLFNFLGIIFTLISLTMIKPVLDLLFMGPEVDLTQYLKANPFHGINKDYLEFELNSWLADMILNHPDGIIEGKKRTLIVVCILTITSFFFKNLFLFLARYFLAPIRNEIIAVIRKEAYQKILSLPISFFSEEKKGDIMSRMTSDVKEIELGLVSVQSVFREPITILVFLISLFLIDVKLTLIILLLAPFTGILVSKIGKGLKRTSSKAQHKIGEVVSVFEETLTGLKIIKAFAVEKIFLEKFEVYNRRFFKLSTRISRKNGLSGPVSEFIGIGLFCVVLLIGGHRVFNGTFSGSTFTTYLLYLYGLLTPIKGFATALNAMQQSKASLERVEKILDAKNKITNHPDAQAKYNFENKIELKNVWFKYENEWVLKGINFTFEKGKSYALVGHSGSGKSTLADLIPRFQEVNEGEVLMDGINIKNIDLSTLRRLTGIVTQDSILFNDTVRNNLTLGIEGISEQQIIKALEIANAMEFVEKLEQGLDTFIGDRGGKLSGGQKQRLCIARAVLQNPPILILDEATSALDTASENVVQDALNKVMQNRTSIVIAHRLSTIKNSDCIVVLNNGEISEIGNHEQLMSNKGIYFELSQLQIK